MTPVYILAGALAAILLVIFLPDRKTGNDSVPDNNDKPKQLNEPLFIKQMN